MQNGPSLNVILPGLFFKAFGLYLSRGKVRSAAKLAVQAQVVETIETGEAPILQNTFCFLTQLLRLPATEARAEGMLPEAMTHYSLKKGDSQGQARI